MKDVSIIIPTKNSEDLLEKCLSSLMNLDYPEDRREVIIVDGHSTDGTLKIAEKYGCKIVYEDVGNQAGAYNVGIKNAEGKYLVFTDADCIVPKDWLKNLIKHFGDGDIASVGGPNLTPNDDTKLAKCVGIVLGFLSKVGARYGLNANKVMETFHNPTCNVAYRREVVEKVGGFNERLITCADEELDYRIREKKYKILYSPEAKVFHYRRASYKKFATQAYKYAIGRAQAIKCHKKMGKWFHFVPSITMFLITLFFMSSFLSPLYFWAGLFLLVCGGFGIGLMGLYLSLKAKMSNLFAFFALIAIWFWAYGLGFFRGLLNRNSIEKKGL
jgi:glycosyltransferase involved in cell wall biosynthesis